MRYSMLSAHLIAASGVDLPWTVTALNRGNPQFFEHGLTERIAKNMQALILAGGAGTRLRTVLTGLNKPMAPVAGRPFLEYLLLQLKKHEIDAVTLCVGYKADLIQAYFGRGDRWGMQISYSYETDFRGTAGALKLAEDLIHEEDF